MKIANFKLSLIRIQHASTYILNIVLYVIGYTESKYAVFTARKIHLQFETERHNIGVYPYTHGPSN